MIDLAISLDENSKGVAIVETNHGLQLLAPDWPQDCDFQLVTYGPDAKQCAVVAAADLAEDIGFALVALKSVFLKGQKKPHWYQRLQKYAAGAETQRINNRL